MAADVRDDMGHEYTCFMRRGEDARLHGRFIRTLEVHDPKIDGRWLFMKQYWSSASPKCFKGEIQSALMPVRNAVP
jgi:hypothetical protein